MWKRRLPDRHKTLAPVGQRILQSVMHVPVQTLGGAALAEGAPAPPAFRTSRPQSSARLFCSNHSSGT